MLAQNITVTEITKGNFRIETPCSKPSGVEILAQIHIAEAGSVMIHNHFTDEVETLECIPGKEAKFAAEKTATVAGEILAARVCQEMIWGRY